MRRLLLSDASAGDVCEDVFVVTGKQLAATKDGKHFIKALLSDKSGQVNARMWNASRELYNAIPDSGFLRVRGRVENYQNNLQFIIEAIAPVKDCTFDIADLIPHTDKDIPDMCGRLRALLGTIRNRHLAALIAAYTDDQRLMDNLCKAPAAMSFHHAFIGGLLEHTLNACEIADCVCKFYPTINRDLVVAGLFLHDIAKTWELTYECSFNYSDSGQLVGHIVKSAIWVEAKRRTAEKNLGEQIPQQLIDVLQHIILSHHGDLANAFGSAKSPATPEAMMVHFIDDMDAKLMLALHATRAPGNNGVHHGNWTEYLKAFGGRLYRPDVAPAEEPVVLVEEDVEGPAPIPMPLPSKSNGKPEPKLVLTNPLFETTPARKP